MNTRIAQLLLLIGFVQVASAAITPQNEAAVKLAAIPLEMAVEQASRFNKGPVVREAARAWLQDSPTDSRGDREVTRSELLVLLYELGDPVSLAFADVFVPESAAGPKRPHQPTAEELALGVIFQLPSAKDLGIMRFATMDDHVENLQSAAIRRAMALRTELGLPEIPPPYTYWKTFPKEREIAVVWVLALVKEAPHGQDLAVRLTERLQILHRLASLKDEAGSTPNVPPSLPETGAFEPKDSTPSEKAASLARWSVVALLIVVAFGVLWMLLRRRN